MPITLHWVEIYKTPYEFGCRLQKKRIECAIMIQAELEQAGIDGSIPCSIRIDIFK